MKSIIACVLVVFAVVALTSAGPTQPPKMCDLICPYPLPEVTQLLPSPERCEEFCQCDGRGAILQVCPPMNAAGDRLYFNPENQVCDWPVNVDCKNN